MPDEKKKTAQAEGFLERCRYVLAVLKIIYKEEHSLIPTSMLLSAVKAGYPYISLVLSSEMVNAVLAEKWSLLTVYAIVLVGGNCLAGLLKDGLGRIVGYMVQKVDEKAVIAVHKKALTLDYATLESPGTLDRMNQTLNAMYYDGGYAETFRRFEAVFTGVLSVLTAVVMVFTLCLREAPVKNGVLGFLAGAPFSAGAVASVLLAVVFLTGRIKKQTNVKKLGFFKERMKAEGELMYMDFQILDDDKKKKTIQLYDMADMLSEEKKKNNDFIFAVHQKGGKCDIRDSLYHSLMNGAVMLFAYLFVGVKALAGCIGIGSVIQYAGALFECNTAFQSIRGYWEELAASASYLSFFNTFMELPDQMATGTIPAEKRKDNEYEIEFRNVSFAYPGTKQPILKEISCKLDMKKKFAVVGRNGAGKTTFIKLLCRLYDPTEGVITLNGVDIRKYDYQEYMNLFGVVFQDFKLFAFPLGENVTAGLEEDEDKIWKCLELSGLKKRAEQLPKGLKTPLYSYETEGIEISGGEAQKLAIARALYKDAPFVILDEPTAALDPVSEYEIYSRFQDLVRDKTSIYISHRMSSCRFCDCILVFENGRIAERGDHEKLVEQGGIYSKLFEAQASYYVG